MSLLVIALFAGLCAAYAATQSQQQTPRKASEKVNSYKRPEPTKPVKPQVPTLNRNREDKFFLERANLLYSQDGDSTGKQIVTGDVLFRKQGMVMYCDSAFYYPASSSIEAFGHVRMEDGDSILITADYANYDGFTDQATLQSRQTWNQVMLEHKSHGDKTVKTLKTDDLDYNLLTGEAIYRTGGTMYNRSMINGEIDTLTSNVGSYNTNTRLAEVTENVYLRNRTSRLHTNRLLYYTDTRVVEIVEPTSITSGQDSIMTRAGRYDAVTGNALLNSRSLIAHRDTAGNVITLEGDSIVYDNLSRVSEAFMFSDRDRRPTPMVITDTARHAVLIGGYGYYNDSTRTAYAEHYPLLKEYSRPDTIFLRAERVFLQTITVEPDSATVDSTTGKPQEFHIAKAFNRARFFRSDLQGLADSITFVSQDSMLFLNRKPIVWSGERMVAGPEIQVHFNDSTPDWALLPRKGLVAEAIEQGFYNQLRAGRIEARFTPAGELDNILAHTDVQTIFLPQEKDSTYNKLVEALGDTLFVDMTGNDMSKLKLWSREGSKVSGSVTPLMSITKQQYYLPDFIAMAGGKRFSEMDSLLIRLEKLRPDYNVYRHGWSDDLGELSFELEDYFNDPNVGIIDDTPIAPPAVPKRKQTSPVTVPTEETTTEEKSAEESEETLQESIEETPEDPGEEIEEAIVTTKTEEEL